MLAQLRRLKKLCIGSIWNDLDKYKNQTCYVIGDGPSLKWMDLRHFNDAPVICCNMLPMHLHFNSMNVIACALVTPWYFSSRLFHRHDYLKAGRKISLAYRQIIRNSPAVDFVVNVSNAPFITGNNLSYVNRRAPFESALLSNFEWFTGGFYSCLGLALYLGFRDIKLIGCDAWTLEPAHEGHWYEYGLNQSFNTLNPFATFYQTIKEIADISVITVTEKSKNVQAISYYEYTHLEPTYRENYNLVNPAYFEVLATCPLYRMYPAALEGS